ncbi:MAG: NAD-dependent succinate-semialdehyde dehydrogenase [Devosiaceae bacterium]|nr:NAD-dependent succinate-semialdehyde dehydrogenase [Devosiaceae bacterium MH13]
MRTYPQLRLFIDGDWRDGREHLPVINPATEEVLGQLPIAEQQDLDDALAAATRGFAIWRATPARTRADVIVRAAALMRARIDEIATSIALELGKPFAAAKLEVIRGCEFLEWDAGEAMRLYGRIIPGGPGQKNAVHPQPVGVVLGLSPWNFPMSQPCRKIAGALASGCSIILKAAEETPAGAIHIAKAFEDAGLPKGVLNLVFGVPADISSYLIAQEPVRLVAFTGSTAVGSHLCKLAADSLTNVLMELGGHAPVVVCDDVDPVEAARSAAIRKFRNSGQVCTSPTRFYVFEDIYEAFCDAFVAQTEKLVVGDPFDAATQMGPVAVDRRLTALAALVEDAVARGAQLAVGGSRLPGKGYFFAPTVLRDVPDDAEIFRTEPFGPLAVIAPVRDMEEALARANSTPFGLAGYGFTHRADRVDALVDGLEVGNLSINTLEASLPETPFGGVKHSGFGREGGTEGLHHYVEMKNVMHSMAIV